MSNIWFTSDSHFHHKNIVKGVSSWENRGDQSQRDFKTLEEHDEHLISQFNKYVKQNDVLWHLGDWSFGGIEQIWNFRKQLNVDTIHLIFGNHDHHIENKAAVCPNCYLDDENEIKDGVSPYKGKYNDSRDNLWDCAPHWLFTSVNHVLHTKIGKQRFFLSHYAHRIWNKSHHGVIHLYGHSHDSLDKHPSKPWGKSMDVGIDSAFRILGEYRPFHIDEILKIMEKREIYFPDHHNKNTN